MERFLAKKGLWLVALSLAVTACNSSSDGGAVRDTLELNQQDSQNNKPDPSQDLRAFCPKTVVRAGTEVYRTFADGVKKDDPGARNSLMFQATITESVRECNYSVNNLNIRVGVRGRVINGPTGATGTINVPVRIAVATVTRDVQYSQLHLIPVTVPEGGNNARFSFVDSNINVPVPENPNLIVYVGFDEGPPSGEAQKELPRVQ